MRQYSLLMLAIAGCAAVAHPAMASQPQTQYRVTILSSAGASGNAINDLGLIRRRLHAGEQVNSRSPVGLRSAA